MSTPGQIRTADPAVRNRVRYPLRYEGLSERSRCRTCSVPEDPVLQTGAASHYPPSAYGVPCGNRTRQHAAHNRAPSRLG